MVRISISALKMQSRGVRWTRGGINYRHEPYVPRQLEPYRDLRLKELHK